MKRLTVIIILLAATAVSSPAQIFRVGVRAGANISDYSFSDFTFNGVAISHGKPKAGFETALVARLTIITMLHVQAEFEYSRTGYGFTYVGDGEPGRSIKVHANRMEIPLELGVNIGPVRLFTGVAFRVAHNEKSNAPSLLKVEFNGSNTGIMGGVGLNIRRLFIDARITGYPRSSGKNTFIIDGDRRRVSVGRNLRWSLSAGVMF